MPELPEIETIRLALAETLIGKTIDEVIVHIPKQFIGDKTRVIGTSVVALQRKGKYLGIKLSTNQFLTVHLKMSGQLFHHHEDISGKYTRVHLKLSDGSHLIFNDIRKFGWFKLSDLPDGPKGHDVLDPQFTEHYLADIIKNVNRAIKLVVLDQDKIAGVGNIYANDALFMAGIRPDRPAKSLTKSEIKKLYQAIKDVIAEGIKLKGSSASEVYRLPDGSKGGYQNRFKVYSRDGQPCLNCKTPIERIVIGGRSSFFCPNCQK